MNTQFDTLEYAAKLEAAGVPPAQAAVHAHALGGVVAELAFAADLKTVDKNVRGEMAAMEKRLLERIDAVRADLLGKIDALRTEVFCKIDALRTEVLGKFDALRTDVFAEMTAIRSDLGERITKVESEIKVMRAVLAMVFTINVGIMVKLLLM